jgi:hypothetical protein
MRPQHTNPEEAVRIHGDVRAMRSVACHLATFRSAAAPCPLLPAASALPPATASCSVAVSCILCGRFIPTFLLQDVCHALF